MRDASYSISMSRKMRMVTGRKTCIWMVIRAGREFKWMKRHSSFCSSISRTREGALGDRDLESLWEMIRKAAGYLVCHGPITPLDRWEEECGYFASTLPVEIAALLGAAEMADRHGEPQLATFLRETADAWNAEIESLLYVTGTKLAQVVGVDGYYARFAGPDQRNADLPAAGSVTLKNHPPGHAAIALSELVSPDVLALVRFGLRAPTIRGF